MAVDMGEVFIFSSLGLGSSAQMRTSPESAAAVRRLSQLRVHR